MANPTTISPRPSSGPPPPPPSPPSSSAPPSSTPSPSPASSVPTMDVRVAFTRLKPLMTDVLAALHAMTQSTPTPSSKRGGEERGEAYTTQSKRLRKALGELVGVLKEISPRTLPSNGGKLHTDASPTPPTPESLSSATTIQTPSLSFSHPFPEQKREADAAAPSSRAAESLLPLVDYVLSPLTYILPLSPFPFPFLPDDKPGGKAGAQLLVIDPICIETALAALHLLISWDVDHFLSEPQRHFHALNHAATIIAALQIMYPGEESKAAYPSPPIILSQECVQEALRVFEWALACSGDERGKQARVQQFTSSPLAAPVVFALTKIMTAEVGVDRHVPFWNSQTVRSATACLIGLFEARVPRPGDPGLVAFIPGVATACIHLLKNYLMPRSGAQQRVATDEVGAAVSGLVIHLLRWYASDAAAVSQPSVMDATARFGAMLTAVFTDLHHSIDACTRANERWLSYARRCSVVSALLQEILIRMPTTCAALKDAIIDLLVHAIQGSGGRAVRLETAVQDILLASFASSWAAVHTAGEAELRQVVGKLRLIINAGQISVPDFLLALGCSSTSELQSMSQVTAHLIEIHARREEPSGPSELLDAVIHFFSAHKAFRSIAYIMAHAANRLVSGSVQFCGLPNCPSQAAVRAHAKIVLSQWESTFDSSMISLVPKRIVCDRCRRMNLSCGWALQIALAAARKLCDSQSSSSTELKDVGATVKSVVEATGSWTNSDPLDSEQRLFAQLQDVCDTAQKEQLPPSPEKREELNIATYVSGLRIPVCFRAWATDPSRIIKAIGVAVAAACISGHSLPELHYKEDKQLDDSSFSAVHAVLELLQLCGSLLKDNPTKHSDRMIRWLVEEGSPLQVPNPMKLLTGAENFHELSSQALPMSIIPLLGGERALAVLHDSRHQIVSKAVQRLEESVIYRDPLKAQQLVMATYLALGSCTDVDDFTACASGLVLCLNDVMSRCLRSVQVDGVFNFAPIQDLAGFGVPVSSSPADPGQTIVSTQGSRDEGPVMFTVLLYSKAISALLSRFGSAAPVQGCCDLPVEAAAQAVRPLVDHVEFDALPATIRKFARPRKDEKSDDKAIAVTNAEVPMSSTGESLKGCCYKLVRMLRLFLGIATDGPLQAARCAVLGRIIGILEEVFFFLRYDTDVLYPLVADVWPDIAALLKHVVPVKRLEFVALVEALCGFIGRLYRASEIDGVQGIGCGGFLRQHSAEVLAFVNALLMRESAFQAASNKSVQRLCLSLSLPALLIHIGEGVRRSASWDVSPFAQRPMAFAQCLINAGFEGRFIDLCITLIDPHCAWLLRQGKGVLALADGLRPLPST